MTKRVHIPVFCDSEKSRAGALLTFKTIRVGFPTAKIHVHLMLGDHPATSMQVQVRSDWDLTVMDAFGTLRSVTGGDLKEITDAKIDTFEVCALKTNDQLIRILVEREHESFAVVDSDVVFFGNCEDFERPYYFNGEYIPAFKCPLAKALTVPRLHTAFLVVSDPSNLRAAIASVHSPVFPQFCPFDPFSPVMTFYQRRPIFYDSCAMLYHSVGGEPFDDAMLDKFEHVFGGSYARHLPIPHQQFIDSCYENPARAKGFRQTMKRFFEERKIAA